MGLLDQFSLAKLTINAWSDKDRSKPYGKPFEVQYNPETLSMRHESVYNPALAQGPGGAEHAWSHSPPRRLTVDLVLDGTNVGYMGIELLVRSIPSVADQVEAFLDLCYDVKGATHEPSYLTLTWHQAVLGKTGFPCRLESVDVRFTSFGRDGSPLHAELAAVFAEQLAPKQDAAKKQLSSPDLTHRRTVIAGDTLPQLCIAIYGSASYYLRVAEANALDDFRNLDAGQELIFPPFARPGTAQGKR